MWEDTWQKKDDEKLGVVLRSSAAAVTQVCTLAFIYWCLSHSWTWMVAFSKQEASVYSDHLLPTLLHLLSLSPPPFFLPLSLHPFLLSISSSSSSQRSSLRKKMSYTVYESTFTWLAKLEQVHLISLSLWLHSCHANPNILSVLS